jgi:hypothetical protein
LNHVKKCCFSTGCFISMFPDNYLLHFEMMVNFSPLTLSQVTSIPHQYVSMIMVTKIVPGGDPCGFLHKLTPPHITLVGMNVAQPWQYGTHHMPTPYILTDHQSMLKWHNVECTCTFWMCLLHVTPIPHVNFYFKNPSFSRVILKFFFGLMGCGKGL